MKIIPGLAIWTFEQGGWPLAARRQSVRPCIRLCKIFIYSITFYLNVSKPCTYHWPIFICIHKYVYKLTCTITHAYLPISLPICQSIHLSATWWLKWSSARSRWLKWLELVDIFESLETTRSSRLLDVLEFLEFSPCVIFLFSLFCIRAFPHGWKDR